MPSSPSDPKHSLDRSCSDSVGSSSQMIHPSLCLRSPLATNSSAFVRNRYRHKASESQDERQTISSFHVVFVAIRTAEEERRPRLRRTWEGINAVILRCCSVCDGVGWRIFWRRRWRLLLNEITKQITEGHDPCAARVLVHTDEAVSFHSGEAFKDHVKRVCLVAQVETFAHIALYPQHTTSAWKKDQTKERIPCA